VLERNPDIGKKIRISGGGRCNFTNVSPELLDGFHSSGDRADAEFFRSVLSRYRPQDFIALMDKHGIRYHEKKLGQLFCDESAGQIVEMLRQECDDAGVLILTDCLVTGLAPGDEEEAAAGSPSAARFQVDYLTLPGRRPKTGARHKIYIPTWIAWRPAS
jgi:predicted flavoprotein YhiN